MWGTRLATTAMVVALVSGCASQAGVRAREADPSDEEATPELLEEEADGPLDRSRDLRATVEVTVSGALDFTWRGTETLTLTRAGQFSLSVNLLALGVIDFLRVPNHPDLRFRWAFSLIRRYRDQPETFTLTNDVLTQEGFKDYAALMAIEVKPGSGERDDLGNDDVVAVRDFQQMVQPCTLTVGEREATGSLVCPRLATLDGSEHITLRAEWAEVR